MIPTAEQFRLAADLMNNPDEEIMENENITINLNRTGFVSLIDVENYIRETITRYEALGPLYIQNYSSINYANGVWAANVAMTTRDPQVIDNVFNFGAVAAVDDNW